MASQVVILIGLQASGKSTFYQSRFAGTHAHISKDNFRHNPNKERRQHQLLTDALNAGRDLVLDNTNPTRESRSVAITLARAAGARIIGYYFESSVASCLERNATRDDRARVPDVAIFSTIKALQRPSPDEGFDELYFVRCDAQGGFSVEPWRPEEHANG